MVDVTPNWQDHRFDTIIDVRTPKEFQEDHIVGAINCPVLKQDEHAKVGTLYRTQGSFPAKVAGASLVTQNISHHINEKFSKFDGSWQSLIYCWRGGMRSRSMAIVLKEIGWRASMLDGGYKAYRKDILRLIPQISQDIRLILLSGHTGTAKTNILKEIEKGGENIIDLESLANHRGSLLGAIPNCPQPSQKFFDSLVAHKLMTFSEGDVVFIESESNKIGNLHVPEGLWRAMQKSPMIEIQVPPEKRAQYLVKNYSDLIEDPDRFVGLLLQAKSRLSNQTINLWKDLITKKSWEKLALSMIENYYDPAYDSSNIRKSHSKIGKVKINDLTTKEIRSLSQRVIKVSKTLKSSQVWNTKFV